MSARRATQSSRTRTDSNRPRDAAVSKQALLEAAQSLFGQRGFEKTTIREVGDLAGVDPSLIARYFGSKADLYVAAVIAEAQGDQPPSEFEGLEDMAKATLDRTDERGLGPVTQALIRSETHDEIRTAARTHMACRLVAPIAKDMTRRGVDEAQLRAEIVVSALIGINLGRTLGWFDGLTKVSSGHLADLAITLLTQDMDT